MASIWSSFSVITLLTFPLLSSPQLTRRREGGTQSVNADSAEAAINKVSLLFIACPEHRPEDRRAFYRLKGTMQMPAAHAKQAAMRQEFLIPLETF